MSTTSEPTTPPTQKKVGIHQIGRLLVTANLDKRGHWIKNRNDHMFHCWAHLGTSKDTDGTTCFNAILGPLGISFGWVQKPPEENDDEQWAGFQEVDPETLEPKSKPKEPNP